MVNVTFWGVRGSTPCASETNKRYGGNTSCVSLEAPGHDPIVLDLGTGLRYYGETLAGHEPVKVLALVTHLHWDHIQGLPFFDPIHQPGASLTVCGRDDHGTVAEAFGTFMKPPFFPVTCEQLIGDIGFRDAGGESFDWGRARITVADVPHTGPTNGYRIDIDGLSIAYVSDHQEPSDGRTITEPVRRLCEGVDLLIHDAQYEAHEFALKSDWGHCTIEFAVHVAAECGAKRLALFHHDPSHDDDTIDRLVGAAALAAEGTDIQEVLAGAERLTIHLTPPEPPRRTERADAARAERMATA